MNLLSKYINRWVAVNSDETEVIASGKSISAVENVLVRDKKKASHIMYVLPFDKHYAPYANKENKRENISILPLDLR